VFIWGIAIGSFLNVLIDRLPQERSIMGRSHCEHCKRIIKWYDLVPLLSFVLLRGRCRYCKYSIPSVVFFVELLTGVIFLSSYLYLALPISHLWLYWGFFACLIGIFFADLKYQIIPDSLQFVLFLFATGLLALNHLTADIWIRHLTAGFVVMTPILLLFLVTRGRGMGFGDVKLSFIIGYTVGIIAGFFALYVSFITGAIVGVALLMSKKTKLKSTIAFGPFLVIGLVIALLWGSLLYRFY